MKTDLKIAVKDYRQANPLPDGCCPCSPPWRFLAPLVHAVGNAGQRLHARALDYTDALDGGSGKLLPPFDVRRNRLPQ